MYGACLTGRVTKTIRTAAIESCFTIHRVRTRPRSRARRVRTRGTDPTIIRSRAGYRARIPRRATHAFPSASRERQGPQRGRLTYPQAPGEARG
jgi:hypothetical protein